jgi:hypothetical protein
VDWVRFTPLFLLAAATSAVGAVLLHLLLIWGFYFIMVMPILAGLGVAVMVRFAVANGHCRSRLAGTLTGLVCGLMLYLGYYYVGMVSALGARAAGQIQLLPRYIHFRLNTDVSRDVGSPKREDEDRPPRAGRFYLNLFAFGFEFLAVAAITTLAGHHRARKPYCEGCKRWMNRELTTFETDKAPAILETLKDSSAAGLATLCVSAPYPSVPNTTLAVEYCPSVKEGALRTCQMFASLKSVTAGPKGPALDSFEGATGKVLLRALQLNDDEVLALLPRFPMFESVSGKTAAGALQQLRVSPPPPTQPAATASITPVEPEYAGRVLTRKTKLKISAFSLLALVMMFGGFGLMAWGGPTAFPDKKRGRKDVSGAENALAMASLGVGGLLGLAALATILFDASFFGNRYLQGLLKRELSSRPTRLVDPDDPEALFVEVVPKANWGKIKLDNASDVGLLRVDGQTREILFEGDRERYRIPAASLISCAVEEFVEGQGSHGAMKLFYVVLRAHHPPAFWEAPIRERGNLGLFKAGKRKKKALALQGAIRAMLVN